jgi:hypothetical protein
VWPGAAGVVESTAMLPRLRPGPLAVGATALATAAVAVGGLVVAASLSVTSAPVPPAAAPPPVAAVPTSSAPPAAQATTAPVAPSTSPSGPVLVVGDSIAVGSAAALKAALGPRTTVDAKVGRQFSDAPRTVAAWVARHDGPVVVDLGANGTVSAADVEAVIAAARDQTVVLVGTCVPRKWQKSNNAVLEAAAARHGSQVVFVDWAGVVDRAGAGVLGSDQVHPTPKGRTLLAAAIKDALGRTG